MDIERLRDLFGEKNDDEYGEFDRVQLKRSNRPDLHAFMMLDRMTEGDSDIVAAAEHDAIYLGVELSELGKVISESDVIDLIRCGVMFDEENDSLMMFA